MLTAEQNAVVEETSSKILVRAGAGTGKTEVLTRRIIHLLEQNPTLSIRDFAIITFTNKATENVLARIKRFLYHRWKSEQDSAEKMRYRYELELLNMSQISTIHKFCHRILQMAGPFQVDHAEYSPSYKITNGGIQEAADRILEAWIEENPSRAFLKIIPLFQVKKQLLTAYRLITVRGLPMEEVLERTNESRLIHESDHIQDIKEELINLLARLHEEYELSKADSISVNDLLSYTYYALKQNQELVYRVQQRYKHIFVDEFQDTSWFQSQILRMICSEEPNAPHLFVVGDVKQAIYQFRGADLQSYEKIEDWIQTNGTVLSLRTNFRSIQPIVEHVNHTFRRLQSNDSLPRFEAEDLRSHDTSNLSIQECVKGIYLEGQNEPETIAQFLLDEGEKGEQFSNYAILFRTNQNMASYEKVFQKAGIPTILIGAGSYFQRKEIMDIYRVLQYIIAPFDELRREEALQTDIVRGDTERLEHIYTSLQSVMPRYSISQVLEQLYLVSNVREYYEEIRNYQAAANVESLKAIIREKINDEHMQVPSFISWLYAKITHDKDQSQVELLDAEVNAVTLITIHRAKGLEFPYVILPELGRSLDAPALKPNIVVNEKTGLEFSFSHYTDGFSVTSKHYNGELTTYTKAYLAEEARVLYVAMTRAEKQLYFVIDRAIKPSKVCYQNWLLHEEIGTLADNKQYERKLQQVLEKTAKKTVVLSTNKWEHQDQAVEAFLARGNGILEMATGTGKTRTATRILNTLFEEEKIKTAIVTVSGTDLLEQWYKELVKHTAPHMNIQIFRHYGDYKELGTFVFNMQMFDEKSILVLSRSSGFLQDGMKFIETASGLKEQSLIIFDEVHGMGSASFVRDLKGRISPFLYRLGLSATPEREYDEEGNAFIEEEIGEVIFSFTLQEAIEKGILSPFDYYPLSYELTKQDKERIKQIIAGYYAKKKAGAAISQDTLYQELSRVRKTSLGKLPVFAEFLKEHAHLLKRSIIFVETKEYGEEVQRLILPYIQNYHTYYGEDNRDNLTKFSRGELDCLITSKRISEGIDIRSVNHVFLFTTDRAKLQTIQRIGRCLRLDPSNPDKRAAVIDFIEYTEEAQDDSYEAIKKTDQLRKEWLLHASYVGRETT